MGDIKSALEIAQEKAKEIGEPTEEELLNWKYLPEGERLAARYLKEDYKLLAELVRFKENAKKYVIEGAADILIRNINLPRNDVVKRTNRRVMDGLKLLKTDKVAVENVYSNLRRLFDHYAKQGEQQKKQAYESLKAEFAAKIQQALQQQMATSARVNIDIERQPQFQEQWQKLRAQLDAQYTKLIDEYRRELKSIS